MTDVIDPATPTQRHDVSRGARESHVHGRPVLLATDGSPAARAAAQLMAALADGRGAVPHAVRAIDTTPVAIPPLVSTLISAADALLGPGVHEPDVRAVRSELESLVGHPVDWPVHVALGTPAGTITRAATQIGAALVVMGLRQHGALDRVTHEETTLNVFRTAACPVLGVTSAQTALPRGAVVGVDFGLASARAARAALDVLADGGMLVLVHVASASRDDESPEGGEEIVERLGVEAAFDRLEADLMVPAEVMVKRRRVEGGAERHIADELLAVADAHRAEMIAVGTRRHGWLGRALHGSVATDLTRDGRCSVLVAPPPPPPQPLDVPEP